MRTYISLKAVFFLSAALFFAGTTASFLYAAPSGYYTFGMHGALLHKIYFILGHQSLLELEADQVERFRELTRDIKKSALRRDADIKILNIDISDRLNEVPLDKDQVYSLIDQKYQTFARVEREMTDIMDIINDTLTPAQKEKMKELWRAGSANIFSSRHYSISDKSR